VRELPRFKETTHCLPSLRILSRDEGYRFNKKDRKEAEERKG